MKNKKFMAMILVLSMMLMGAGYAAWTQSFDVEATVDTGELKVVYHEGGSIFGQMWVEEFPYQTSTYELMRTHLKWILTTFTLALIFA